MLFSQSREDAFLTTPIPKASQPAPNEGSSPPVSAFQLPFHKQARKYGDVRAARLE